jgi:glycosyltransferase involved in cell wall biosynthesis
MGNIKVSFVVIALNATSNLDNLFECLNKQTYPHNLIEVVLVDSDSRDNTKEKMLIFKDTKNNFDRIIVLDNPQRTLPCGWNIALDAVQGDAVLRVDAHTIFPPEFIELNVCDLDKGENICGGKVISIPADKNRWSCTLNEAENSMFGGSVATFRHAESAQYVSTAAFAIYRKSVFDQVGRYNEQLTRTEDNEMHYRMKQAGYKFFYDPSIVSYRETRSTLGKLLRQKYLNGYWIGRTIGMEPRCFSIYHFVPFVFVTSIILVLFLAIFGIYTPSMIMLVSYGFVNVMMTALATIHSKDKNLYFICLPIIFLLLHTVYGVGTLIGLLDIHKNLE